MNVKSAEPISKAEVMTWISWAEGKPFYSKHIDPNGKDYIVGYGFNLTGRDKNEILQIFKQLGINYQKIMSGKGKITHEQAVKLLDYDINRLIIKMPSIIPNFDKLPKDAKLVVVDMAYNMGIPKFRGFKDFIAALSNYDYNIAAKEMVNSNWYNQVGKRSKALTQKL